MLKRDAPLAVSSGDCAGVLRALGDETRLRILISLLIRQKCVTELVREIQRGQPHISHHLRILRDTGLVEGVRDGRRVCYRVAPDVRRALVGRERNGLDFGCCRLTFPPGAGSTSPTFSLRRRGQRGTSRVQEPKKITAATF